MLKEKVPPSSTAMPARIFYKRRAYCTYNPLYWIILLVEIQYFTYTPLFRLATINRDPIFFKNDPGVFTYNPSFWYPQGKHAGGGGRRRIPFQSTPRSQSLAPPTKADSPAGFFVKDRERAICRLRSMHAPSLSVALVWSARARRRLRLVASCRRRRWLGFCRLAFV